MQTGLFIQNILNRSGEDDVAQMEKDKVKHNQVY